MYEYKEDIIKTRSGCVGSSDAKMLAQIANLGSVPRSAYPRLAVVRGLVAPEDTPTTAAMAFGDFVENAIFDNLVAQHGVEDYQSNPCLVSQKYSRKNVRCIDHVDIYRVDEANKTLYAYEVKASKSTFDDVRYDYRAQLYHHTLMLREEAARRGSQWRVVVILVHYDTYGVDLNEAFVFEPERITMREVKFKSAVFDLAHAMDIVDAFLDTFNEYYEGDCIDADILPDNVRETFNTMAGLLAEIKEREEKVEAFKAKLFDFLTSHDIKQIKNEAFTITRVDATTSVTFDAKRYLEELEAAHPVKAKRLRKQYEKRTNKKGFAKITIR